MSFALLQIIVTIVWVLSLLLKHGYNLYHYLRYKKPKTRKKMDIKGMAAGPLGFATTLGTVTLTQVLHEITSSSIFVDITLILGMLFTLTLIAVNLQSLYLKSKGKGKHKRKRKRKRKRNKPNKAEDT